MILDNSRPPWRTEEIDDPRTMARTFLKKESEPNNARWAQPHSVHRDFWRLAGEAGLLCISIPEKYGGGGGTFAH